MKKFRFSICILGVLLFSTLLHAQLQVSYTEYSVHAPGGTVADTIQPYFIAAGPDGALWFTEDVFDFPGKNCVIGRITTSGVVTEYSILTANTDVTGITAGPDGALWYSVAILDRSGGKIGRITTGGVITEYPLPIAGSWPSNITAGPDGALWFALSIAGGGGSMIGRVTTAGVFNGYPISSAIGSPGFLATGPDGALWFTLSNGSANSIGRITTAGALTVYPVNTLSNAFGGGITTGSDGALWFTEPNEGASVIGRITTAGVVTQYPIPGQAGAITGGSDGALWFILVNFGGSDASLGRISTAGVVTTYPLSTLQPAGLQSIVTGPDGALWATDRGGWIGRAAISADPTPTLSASAPPLGAPGVSYSAALSASGGTPPYSHWTVSSGSLPPGLVLDAATGAITGNATTAGTFNFGVTFEDSTGASSTEQIVSITIIVPNPGLSIVGSMPHLAAEENWTTTFTLINKTAVQSPARLSLFGDLDSGTLPLPLIFPQQPGGNPLFTASFEQNIAPNASLIVQTAGPQNGPVKVGSAQVASTGAIDGFAIFHHVITGQETVVPLEGPGVSSYLLAFDNTGGNVLGIALANPLGKSQNIGVGISDDSGTFIEADSLIIPANGHISFVLPAFYPVTANRRGTIKFYAFQGGQQFGVLGMRFAAPNNALTTIPGLTGGQSGISSIAHIATGNGWKTTFVLVNFNRLEDVLPSPFQLNFFDDNGNPLALPVGFPQTASGTTAVTSSVQQTLGPNEMLIIETNSPLSDAAPTIGSAQLSTTSPVAGFVMFRYEPNGQEAVVPFETRKAGGYLLAFDNTAGTATGVAVNSVSSQPVGVPVIIRDDAGNLLATDTLHLAANGHLAFTLAADRYPMTANIRGTIEFDTPSGAQIGALAFRIPVSHTFTTLPALTVPGSCVPTLLGCL